MGMREQAIEEVRVYCGGAGDAPMLHTAHHFAERALTVEVALAEAREALTSAKMYLELNHIAGKTAAKSDCDGCRVLSAAAAWLELHKEKGTTR